MSPQCRNQVFQWARGVTDCEKRCQYFFDADCSLGDADDGISDISILPRKNRPQIKQDPSIFDAGNDRRIGCPQVRRQVVGT